MYVSGLGMDFREFNFCSFTKIPPHSSAFSRILSCLISICKQLKASDFSTAIWKQQILEGLYPIQPLSDRHCLRHKSKTLKTDFRSRLSFNHMSLSPETKTVSNLSYLPFCVDTFPNGMFLTWSVLLKSDMECVTECFDM